MRAAAQTGEEWVLSVNQVFVSLVILLTPGIVAVLVLDTATQHQKWDNFRLSLYIAALGFLSYFLLFILQAALDCIPWLPLHYNFKVFDIFSDLQNAKIGKNIYWEVFLTCILGFAAALAVSCSVNHKWLAKLANKWRISEKYGDESLFYYYLNQGNSKTIKWLTIRDYSKKTVYTGELISYSEQDGMQEILLSDVDVYPEGQDNYHIDEIYISAKIGDISIEPLTTEKQQTR